MIEGLETNTALESLWLGKNKIETITGLETLSKIRQLDVQHNRLQEIGNGLQSLHCLSELYLAWNAIESVAGLPYPSNLSTLDLTKNKLANLEGIGIHASTLEELWISQNCFDSFESLTPLTQLTGLTCVYLEHSPISKDFEYRKTLTRMVPSLEQLDATPVNRTVY